jgi:peroxiredoxin
MGNGNSKVKPKHQHLKEGDKVPDVIMKARKRIAPTEEVSSFVWQNIMTSELFKGKRVVVFSIPGGMYIFPSSSINVCLGYFSS